MALVITDKAADEVRKAMAVMKFEEEMYLRVAIMASAGCGVQYGLTFVPTSELKTDDTTSELSGLKVVLDSKSAILLEETTIDFFDSADKKGFTFQNNLPTSSCGSCGCGSKKCG